MRIWDIHPGYLNRQSLLGEHRELHGIVSILVNKKKGYARHPETLRWVGFGWALHQRHQQLRAEIMLRGYKEQSPVDTQDNPNQWPAVYIDDPLEQIRILRVKYEDREPGRIPLPATAQQIWSQHKYSVLARNPDLYKEIGRTVSRMKPRQEFPDLARQLTELLRESPQKGNMSNALQHMWGYVSDFYNGSKKEMESWPPGKLLAEIQSLVINSEEPYLTASTALSELQIWT